MPYRFTTQEDQQSMLRAIGASTIDELFQSVPEHLKLNRPLQVPDGLSEIELTTWMQDLANKNAGASSSTCFLGGGAYDHFVPAVVDAIASRGEFFTSYTPYQPEVSQGNLQVMFEYETLICQLTGMDVSNASLYDGASATVEAVLMCLAANEGRKRVVVPSTLHPHYRQSLATYLQWIGGELVELPFVDGIIELETWRASIDSSAACIVIQQPNFFGCVEHAEQAAKLAADAGVMVVGVADPISLGIFKQPRKWGADIYVAEGQVLGNPLQFGGPYLGILACKESLVRRVPGRIAGQTEDRTGRRCWVLTLQTREQHIRRDKATSNICTNQGLFALRATIYLSLLGPYGLRETAALCAHKAAYLKSKIAELDRFEIPFASPGWREFVVRDRVGQVDDLVESMLEQKILAGIPLAPYYPNLSDCLLVAVTEKRTKSEMDRYVGCLKVLHSEAVIHA